MSLNAVYYFLTEQYFPDNGCNYPDSIPSQAGAMDRDQRLTGIDAHSQAKASEQGIYLPLDGSMALDDMDRFIIKTALERADNNLDRSRQGTGCDSRNATLPGTKIKSENSGLINRTIIPEPVEEQCFAMLMHF